VQGHMKMIKTNCDTTIKENPVNQPTYKLKDPATPHKKPNEQVRQKKGLDKPGLFSDNLLKRQFPTFGVGNAFVSIFSSRVSPAVHDSPEDLFFEGRQAIFFVGLQVELSRGWY
jgi:hypothetical protein